MMKHEFEALAGYEVTAEDYNSIIEPMYMATDLTKEDFVKTINKKCFAVKPLAKMVKEMKAQAKHLKETCNHYTDYEGEDALEAVLAEYISRKYPGQDMGHFINRAYTISDNRGCTYPHEVQIYGRKTYATVETLVLA